MKLFRKQHKHIWEPWSKPKFASFGNSGTSRQREFQERYCRECGEYQMRFTKAN